MRDNRTDEGRSVTLAEDIETARDWAKILENWEARRSGKSIAQARSTVARRTGVPEGKLYSLRRNRLKDISHRLFVGLGEAVVAELQNELRRVNHELQTLRQIGRDPRDGEMQAVLASRQKIMAALGLDASNEGAA